MAKDVQNNKQAFSCSPLSFSLREIRAAKFLVIVSLLLSLSACQAFSELFQKPTPPPEPLPVPVEPLPELSSAPIKNAERGQVVFAQTALTTLDYRLGAIDGFWGPRSAAAMKKFEQEHNIDSADGFVSEWNLDELSKLTGLTQQRVIAEYQAKMNRKSAIQDTKIAAKLEGKLADTGPQLIIVERDYDVFSKPNPYSEKIIRLRAGTGVYIVSQRAGWYTVESVNRRKGYIQVD